MGMNGIGNSLRGLGGAHIAESGASGGECCSDERNVCCWQRWSLDSLYSSLRNRSSKIPVEQAGHEFVDGFSRHGYIVAKSDLP